MTKFIKKFKDVFTRPTTKFLQEQETNNPDFFKGINDGKSESLKEALPSVIACCIV